MEISIVEGQYLRRLAVRYRLNYLSVEEQKVLSEWLMADPANQGCFERYLQKEEEKQWACVPEALIKCLASKDSF
ncbi:hypothetical protein [Chitinophaga japonensis]|uniref:Uncharacterized protein n=1 Tax=Chitinophaga japonensis TaxID=104662 RepID=A0A562T2E8_CHIJA|nr:hypothetical protein [Chitinophaga japonensis]TWI87831.1 hypothetical protein LX66_1902 [Chitinophaga japonensis]